MNDSDIKILRDSIDILIDENERLKKKIKILEAEKIKPRDDEIDWSYHPSRTFKPCEFPPQVGDWPPGPQVGDWPLTPEVGDVPRYPNGYPYWPVFPPCWYYPYYPYNNHVTVSSNATDSKGEE